jgi:serine/threonine-protein kinase PknK
MLELPPRYEPIECLGQGGGGEVWAVRDKLADRTLALKILSEGAGEAEVLALVREAMALSGLEGLGVPQVVAFGALGARGRRYMVRELVVGKSLDDVLEEGTAEWLEPLARACDQLTAIHRAGLLHGDLKPANIIVGEGGRGTLVDLGLAAPWRDGGTSAQGLTPKYAAPELFAGEPITVRAEVYALGATLGEGLARRGWQMDDSTRIALARVAARATEDAPNDRFPSVDELASALRQAAGLTAPGVTKTRADAAWPVVGLEATAERLAAAARALGAGEAIAVEGPPGSGRTTLARRLAWTLGVEGRAVAAIEAPRPGMTAHEAVDLELAASRDVVSKLTIVVDDSDALDEAARVALRKASEAGARIVGVGSRRSLGRIAKGRCATFDVPPLDDAMAEELVRRAMPSLPDALRARLVERAESRPGRLRAMMRSLAGRVVVSADEIDAALTAPPRGTIPPQSHGRVDTFALLDRALETGRFDEADEQIAALGDALSDDDRVRLAIAHGRVATGRGDGAKALSALLEGEALALASPHARPWQLAAARAHLRAGDYGAAAKLAALVGEAVGDDVLAADALSVGGVALALTGDDAAASKALARALEVAKSTGDPRVEAVALGSSAIWHQRAGRLVEARTAYEASLSSAEKARDAATVAAMRLNLAGMAQGEGDLALALAHLEAAVDMGRRAGSHLAVQQALLNLALLDLYLGRYARASASIDSLVAQTDRLGPSAKAQLASLRAEHATRIGDTKRGAELYAIAADAWDAHGRGSDAAESRLEGLLAKTREPSADPRALAREIDAIKDKLGESGFGEHAALAGVVRATIARLAGDEIAAKRAIDAAVEAANKGGRREWAWQALDFRARLEGAQGSVALARRDTEAALAMLEESASKLPRDLREVYWDDPRRRALRQAHTATMPLSAALPPTARTIASAGTTSLFASRPAEDRLSRILEITRELASEHDMHRLLARVTDHAVALLGAERGLVVLANDEGDLTTETARDRAGDDPHASFSRSVAERVIREGEPVVATSARDDVRLAKAVSVHQLMIQSIACVPIRGAPPVGRPIGALYVETRLRPGARFDAELPTLMAFADQAAIAIENARLLDENRARAEDLSRANAELEKAHARVSDLLGKRTEQLVEARRDLKEARLTLRGHFGYAGLVGTSAPMRRLYAIMDRVKDADVPVLITGESGTGKEVVAKAIHDSGPSAKRPFLGVNCGAIPENLLESELFGHVKGAFTGAERDRKGLFREAEGGTILLDEIGEMPHKMQASLLRVLQEKCVRPIGGAKEEPVDVRVIAATNRDLSQMVAAGTFREDLYYRLHVVELQVPALRERLEDIAALLDHFLKLFAARHRRERKTVSREALRVLGGYNWPGNVRQLEHVLLNAWLMGEGDEITPEDLEIPTGVPRSTTSETRPVVAGRAKSSVEFKESERERILGALTACNWNRAHAAKMIGVPRRTFYRRLKEFGIL